MTVQRKTPEKMDPRPAQSRNPERSKQVLIKATLDTLATEGISGVTVSSIIKRAGLSRGMIHLHFGGKDNLIAEAARTFAKAYYDEMDRQLADHQHPPDDLVRALVRADLSEELLNEYNVAVWHALRGVARFNEKIARHSDTRDARLRSMLFEAFHELHGERSGTNANRDANDATLATLAMLEGMWTDYMVHPGKFDREAAARVILRVVSNLFPSGF